MMILARVGYMPICMGHVIDCKEAIRLIKGGIASNLCSNLE